MSFLKEAQLQRQRDQVEIKNLGEKLRKNEEDEKEKKRKEENEHYERREKKKKENREEEEKEEEEEESEGMGGEGKEITAKKKIKQQKEIIGELRKELIKAERNKAVLLMKEKNLKKDNERMKELVEIMKKMMKEKNGGT
jgi:hypothetical protein